MLEVGCGSGQLTRSLVARGLYVTALEPGRRLISLTERKLGDSGRVDFVNGRFEDVPIPHSHFGAVFSASAFHWTDPDVSWEKAARVLLPGGTLALISYFGLEEERSRRDQDEVLAALARVAPEIAVDWPRYYDLASIVAGVEERSDNVSEVWAWLGSYDVARSYTSRLFSDVQILNVPLLMEHTADELNAYLGTTSFYARLSPSQRQELRRENVAIYERLGRPIRSSTLAVVVTARRSNAAVE